MGRGPRALGAFVAGVVLIVGACATSGPTPTPTQPAGVVGSTPAPTPSTLAVVSGTPTPAPTPAPTSPAAPSAGTPAPAGGSVTGSAPTPTPNSNSVKPPAPPAGWTAPRQVSKVAGCYQLTAGIDVASRYHIAAECGQSIRYFVSNPDGSWTGTLFAHPAKRQDLDPQLALQRQRRLRRVLADRPRRRVRRRLRNGRRGLLPNPEPAWGRLVGSCPDRAAGRPSPGIPRRR